MDELITWLRAQLDDDERKVAAMEREETRVRTAPIFQGNPLGWLAGVDIFVSSKRWRAEIEAKRAMLDEAESWLNVEDEHDPVQTSFRASARWMLPVLAQPYADRPGFRDEWRA